MEELVVALGLAFGAAGLFYPARRLDDRLRRGVMGFLSGIILLAPVVIPADLPLHRLIAALNATALPLKMVAYHHERERFRQTSFIAYLFALPNWFRLVPGDDVKPSRTDRMKEIRSLFVSGAVLIAALLLLRVIFTLNWTSVPFLVEHVVKVVALYGAILPLSRAGAALWRLAGQPADDFFHAPHLAVTPAEFWRRWNRPAQRFFYESVFLPLRGSRHPLLAAFPTFACSAVIHEYVFGIADGRFQGWQTIFFLLQACGVALTLRMRPRGFMRGVGLSLTLAFVLLSSVCFFISVDRLVPFYYLRSR